MHVVHALFFCFVFCSGMRAMFFFLDFYLLCRPDESVEFLTKGDNNSVNDRGLYTRKRAASYSFFFDFANVLSLFFFVCV